MRALVLSDIHSNREALGAVLSRVRRKSFDHIICLGDFVGYGAEPNPVLDTMREVRGRKLFIRGNHDRVAAGIDDGLTFNPPARQAALWTRDRLSASNRRFLNSLVVGPVAIDDLLLCHGSPHDEDEYVFTDHHAAQILLEHPASRVILHGHTHLPVVFSIDDQRDVGGELVRGEQTVKLLPSRRYLINPGSVGQPRDRDPRASCAILDTTRMTVQFFRVPYDVGRARAAIVRAGLPSSLGDRLSIGS